MLSLLLVLAGLALAPGSAAGADRTIEFGDSVEGRDLRAHRIGPRDAERTVLVVGSIHGNEDEGHEIVARLRREKANSVAIWLAKTVNPDGVVAGKRGNARGVDLNRNFPVDWQPSQPSSGYYSGPEPFSEPESRAVKRLARRIDPDIVISYHQPWNQVLGSCKGADRIQRHYAELTDMEFACRGGDLPGTATKWLRRTGARGFVVELGAGELPNGAAAKHARAVMSVALRTGRR